MSDPDKAVSSEDPTQPASIRYEPQPGDEKLNRDSAFPEKYQLLTLESFPPQFVLVVSGNLPDPCHQLRAVVAAPDAENKINIDLYSLTDPEKACAEVITPFEANIALGKFATGHYTVWVNGEQIAEFDA